MSRSRTDDLRFASRDAYRRWAEAQPRGRFERIGGAVVAMSPQRGAHLRAKSAVWLALRQAIAAAGVPCEALPDGATVEIGEDTDYEPDAVVTCGARMDNAALAAPNPIIVVEVLSPSSWSLDSGANLSDYFRVPSIHHYLIVRTDRDGIIHHRRAGATIETMLIDTGRIDLDPPGISVLVEHVFAWRQA